MAGNYRSGQPGGNPNRPILGPGPGRKKGSKNRLTIERVEQEIRRIALLNPKELFEGVHGNRRTFTLREIKRMSDDVAACIASVKVRTENLVAGDDKQDTTVEIRLWNKIDALTLCAKHFHWIEDKMKLEVNVDDLAKRIEEGRKRNAERDVK